MIRRIVPGQAARWAGGLFLLLVAGCMRNDEFLRNKFALPPPSPAERAMAAKSPPIRQTAQLASADKDLTAIPHDQRVMIYTASLVVVVADAEEAIRQATRLAAEFHGHVQKIDGDEIVIRVPVARYDEALAAIEHMGTVSHRQVEATDVTEEFVDLKARLKNARAVKARLEALLAKAEDVKAAIEVEKELKRVAEEVEQLEAKLELINNRVALSTIAIRFVRIAAATIDPRAMQLPFPWLRQLDPYRLWR